MSFFNTINNSLKIPKDKYICSTQQDVLNIKVLLLQRGNCYRNFVKKAVYSLKTKYQWRIFKISQRFDGSDNDRSSTPERCKNLKKDNVVDQLCQILIDSYYFFVVIINVKYYAYLGVGKY